MSVSSKHNKNLDLSARRGVRPLWDARAAVERRRQFATRVRRRPDACAARPRAPAPRPHAPARPPPATQPPLRPPSPRPPVITLHCSRSLHDRRNIQNSNRVIDLVLTKITNKLFSKTR